MCPQDNFELEVRKLIGKDLVGTRIVTGAISGKASCIGSLKIVHGNEDELGNFQELFLESDSGFKKDGGYYNIRRRFPILRTNVIIQLITQGSCCWEIYEKRKFKGEKQYLHQGEHFPDIQPASIRRVKCRYWNKWDDMKCYYENFRKIDKKIFLFLWYIDLYTYNKSSIIIIINHQ